MAYDLGEMCELVVYGVYKSFEPKNFLGAKQKVLERASHRHVGIVRATKRAGPPAAALGQAACAREARRGRSAVAGQRRTAEWGGVYGGVGRRARRSGEDER